MITSLKAIAAILIVLFCSSSLSAQSLRVNDAPFYKDNIKLNVLALPLRTASIQYEHGFSHKISAALSLRLQPYGHIPLKSAFESAFHINSAAGKDFSENARTSSFAVTAEGRYYFGKRPLNGFYIAPFLRYSTYKIGWVYDFHNQDSSVTMVDMTGRASGIAGGILFGAQWHLKGHWLIDWWMAGPSYGQMSLVLDGVGGLNQLNIDEQTALVYGFKTFTVGGSKFDAALGDNSIHVTGSIPFPGIRTGLCIGYSF